MKYEKNNFQLKITEDNYKGILNYIRLFIWIKKKKKL